VPIMRGTLQPRRASRALPPINLQSRGRLQSAENAGSTRRTSRPRRLPCHAASKPGCGLRHPRAPSGGVPVQGVR
jgi:hypothetical protein